MDMTRVACIGDSITWGFTLLNPWKQSYPAVLQQMLGDDYEVRNFGYNDASARFDADTPYVKKRVYRHSLEWNPDIVLIMLGSNDTKKRNWDPEIFKRDYGKLVDSYVQLPSKPRVILVAPIRIFNIGKFLGLYSETMENGVRPAIREIAAGKGLELIDLRDLFTDSGYMMDGIHPQRTGSRMIAEAIYSQLKPNNMTITGIGETVLDLIFQNMQPQAAVPGGSTFNAMISLGRTIGRDNPEIDLRMVSQIGDDPVGDIVFAFMKENKVSTAAMVRSKGQSTVSMAMLDENRNAKYEFFRDLNLPAFEAPDLEFKPGDIVLFGSFFAINPETREQTRSIIRKARAAGATVYYDINFRKSHDAKTSLPLIEENIALSDIVRGSSEDIEALYGSYNAAEVYAKHIAPLCKNFICTKGARETEVFSPGFNKSYPVPQETPVVSTIGAGDNFNAGTVYALTKLGKLDWDTIVPIAHAFSANVVASMFNYVDENFRCE